MERQGKTDTHIRPQWSKPTFAKRIYEVDFFYAYTTIVYKIKSMSSIMQCEQRTLCLDEKKTKNAYTIKLTRKIIGIISITFRRQNDFYKCLQQTKEWHLRRLWTSNGVFMWHPFSLNFKKNILLKITLSLHYESLNGY